jgi:glutamate-5-semialdehyde dehydrogenase
MAAASPIMNVQTRPAPVAASSNADIAALMRDMGLRARAAARRLAQAPSEAKNAALAEAARLFRVEADAIVCANERDVAQARAGGAAESFVDRLLLTPERIEAMAKGLDDIRALPDPVGATMESWSRPSGLKIERVRVPIGVIGVVFESRPNVTADAGALCLKSGNAAILRGGSESFHSAGEIAARIRRGLSSAGLPEDAVQLVPTVDRAAVGEMLRMEEFIDLMVPRGGRPLIERVTAESRVPVLKHYEGLVHVYVDRAADVAMARDLVANAKMRRVSVCGAAETLLVDRAALDTHLKPILDRLIDLGCEVRADAEVRAHDSRAIAATEDDWRTEYLAPIIAVRAVDGVDGAIAHIAAYGSGHTDAIVTQDAATAERFLHEVDSAIVMHNASTQYADGGEFGLGGEIGISTNRLHARGPVGLVELTTYKNVVRGAGQTRP